MSVNIQTSTKRADVKRLLRFFEGTVAFALAVVMGTWLASARAEVRIAEVTGPTVIRPTAATAEHFDGSAWRAGNYHDENTLPICMINNNGLYLSQAHTSAATLNTGDPVPATPTTVTAEPTGWFGVYTAWMSTGVSTVAASRVTFDLGGSYNVSRMLFWNYAETGPTISRGVKLAELSSSTDGTNYATLGTFSFSEAAGNFYEPMQTATFAAPVVASFIRIKVLETFGDPAHPEDSRSGINKVRFVSEAASKTTETKSK